MGRPAEILVLCEDRAHEQFVRGYFVAKGVDSRAIRRLPSAHNNATAISSYPRELIAVRKRGSAALVVVVDADSGTVDARRSQLNAVLNGLCDPPAEGERIAILVPRRNIETWIQFLVHRTKVD